MLDKPKPKITKQDDILLKHDFKNNSNSCRRCGQNPDNVQSNKLECITETRAAGNAAIGRLTQRTSGYGQ